MVDQFLVFTCSFSLIIDRWTLGLAVEKDQRCLFLRGGRRRDCQSSQVLGELSALIKGSISLLGARSEAEDPDCECLFMGLHRFLRKS